MSEQILDDPEPVRASRWRLAIILAVLFGGGLYASGWFAGHDDSGRFPAQFVMMSVMLAPPVSLLGFTLWWLFFGDGRWYHRILGILGSGVMIAAAVAAAHSSIRPFTALWGVPLSVGIAGLALVATPFAQTRRVVGPIIWLLAIAPWLMLRLDGVTGEFVMDTSYRWNPSTGELADAQLADRATSLPTQPISVTNNGSTTSEDWPGFRGYLRTGEVPAAATHGWNGSQPRELWRHEVGKVGPAWSSFCVVGNALFTQEQRGKSESVVCYRVDNGEEVWSRGEPSLHYDQPSGTGPRATPTYANGQLYAVSATGIISCLQATTGEPVWVVNLLERFEATKPAFGFSTSPLVVGDLVIIHPGSPKAPRLVALDVATGKTKWVSEALGTDGYSSPHPATIQGVDQVLVFNGSGLSGHEPATGRELWHYDWTVAQNEPTTVQPLVLPDGRIVIGGGNIGLGIRCVAVRKDGDGWSATEAWRTSRFTPRFNDVVRSGDYLYGLDGGILSCIKLSDGQRVWKDGRYGAGQLLLVGDKLLIVSESGQLACVAAKPDEYEELWKMDVVKGKTWNHPAIAHGRLFVRNMGEMVVFDLPGSSGGQAPAVPVEK